MANSYTTVLGLIKPEVNADQDLWGTHLDTDMDLIDEAVGGYIAISVAGGDVTLTTTQGAANQSRPAFLKLTGSPGVDRTITAPDVKKGYYVINGVGDSSNILFKAVAGSAVTIPAGYSAKVYTDGATNAVILLLVPTGATVVSTTATQTLANKTLTSPTLTNAILNTPTINGSATNDSAGSGVVGQLIKSTVVGGAAVSLTSGVGANVTSISLTAGDWDVSGVVHLTGANTTTVGGASGALSAVSASVPTYVTGDTDRSDCASFGAGTPFNGGGIDLVLGPTRVSAAGTTTYYLVCNATFAVSTASAFGTIRARRVR